MTISINWQNREKTILCWVFPNNWDWDDYAEAQQLSNSMIEQVKRVVYIMWDVRQSQSLPEGFILGYKQTIKYQSPQIGAIVIVGANIYVSQMIGSFKATFEAEGQRFHLSRSMDDARQLIDTRFLQSTY